MIFLFLIAFALLLVIYVPDIRHEPMTFDEEVEWLMSCGLTKEEAEEIANL